MRIRAALAAVVLAPLLLVSTHASASSVSTPNKPCGVMKSAPRYTHVVWIVLENVGYPVVGSHDAPYLNSLGAKCALATNDTAVAHPSLPNYIALTSGTTQGVVDDLDPSSHPLAGPSIFSELNGNWKSLVESMPSACDRVTSGSYAARHNPAVYYPSLEPYCSSNDVPLSMPLHFAPAFTFISPNICNDMHSCPVSTGDRWLSRIVPQILVSPQYRSKSLVLFITFDENDAQASNRIPTWVIAPSVRVGQKVALAFTHYSLLRTTEELLHVALLGSANSARSMLKPFNL